MATPKKKTSKSRRDMRRSHDALKANSYMECPNCGKYAEAKTGFFARKKIDCACGYTIDVRTDKLTSRICAHCGKLMTEGEKIAATGHAWGEYVVTTAPTCNAFGVQTRTCSVCGETETDSSVPKVEHTFGEWKVTTEPTVEAEGVETRTCSGCGQEETRSVEKLAEPAPQPKNNTALIVIIVVVVLAGAGVAAFFVLKNKKK